MDLRGKLRIIESTDPDSWDAEATKEDYAAHKAFAIDVFGEKVWEIYHKGDYEDLRY